MQKVGKSLKHSRLATPSKILKSKLIPSSIGQIISLTNILMKNFVRYQFNYWSIWSTPLRLYLYLPRKGYFCTYLQNFVKLIPYFFFSSRWMQIRRIVLKTVDGLSPLPMSSAWVRDGLFVIGKKNASKMYE